MAVLKGISPTATGVAIHNQSSQSATHSEAESMLQTEAKLHNTYHFRVEDVHDVSKARRKGMDLALEMGFVRADATKIAVVISELARNIFVYAKKGSITIIVRNDPNSKQYIKIIADDDGPGINNVDQAMNDGYTTSSGLGLGLSGSQRLVDEFHIRSEPGHGTTITAIKWLS